jgi:hypothetical protein
MDNRTRGKPPVGTYVGKVIEPVRIGQRESKTGSMYDSGDIAVHVKGGSGPVQVDGEYEFTGLSFDILDYKPDKEGNVAAQLLLYARCLRQRTGLSNITCAYFDNKAHLSG